MNLASTLGEQGIADLGRTAESLVLDADLDGFRYAIRQLGVMDEAEADRLVRAVSGYARASLATMGARIPEAILWPESPA